MTNISTRKFRLYDLFAVLFVTVLILSIIMAQKLFNFWGATFTTAIIVFPISYILGDVLTEVYGYAAARRIIWMGFIANVIMVLFIEIAVLIPPATVWPNQVAFETVLHQVPRIVAASLAAYLAGEFVNSFVLAKLKILTNGRHLWTRTIGSTIVGQAVDSTIFVTLAFAGIMPVGVIVSIIWSSYIFKVVYEIAVTPLTYIVVNYVKRIEGVDVYDKDTNFTPFGFAPPESKA